MRIFFDYVRLGEESVSQNRKKRAAGTPVPHKIAKNVHFTNDNRTVTQFLYTTYFE